MTLRLLAALLALILVTQAQSETPATPSSPASLEQWTVRALEGGRAELEIRNGTGLVATCRSRTFRVGEGSQTMTFGVCAKGEQVHLRAAGCRSGDRKGAFRASADRLTRGGKDGAVLTLEGHARLRWQRQGQQQEVIAAERIVVNLLTGHVEATRGSVSLAPPATPSACGDFRTPILPPIKPVVINMCTGHVQAAGGSASSAPADASSSYSDSRTPILPPIQPGERPLCADPPDRATILRALPRLNKGVPYIYEQSQDDIDITVEKIADTIDPPRFFPLIGPAQLHHCHYKCTVYYTEAVQSDYPFPYRAKRRRVETVYIDRDCLHLVASTPAAEQLFKNVGYGRDDSSLMMMVTPRIIISEEEEAIFRRKK